jgi:hypothetical protein
MIWARATRLMPTRCTLAVVQQQLPLAAGSVAFVDVFLSAWTSSFIPMMIGILCRITINTINITTITNTTITITITITTPIPTNWHQLTQRPHRSSEEVNAIARLAFQKQQQQQHPAVVWTQESDRLLLERIQHFVKQGLEVLLLLPLLLLLLLTHFTPEQVDWVGIAYDISR